MSWSRQHFSCCLRYLTLSEISMWDMYIFQDNRLILESGCGRRYSKASQMPIDTTVKQLNQTLDFTISQWKLKLQAVNTWSFNSECGPLPIPKFYGGTNLTMVLSYISENHELRYLETPQVTPDAYRNTCN